MNATLPRPCRWLLSIWFSLGIVCFGWAVAQGADQQRPNIVWLSAEDISPHLGCYGDPHAITPALDQLATEGVRYTHAFTTAGVCAPCRSGIITGMYQTTLGTHHMRCNAQLPPFIRPFPAYLRQAGYYCTNNSKTDYQFRHPADTWDESSGRAHWRNRPAADQPFFAVFNFTGCHESGIAGAAKYRSVTADLTLRQRQDAELLTTLPPYYPDTEVTREDWKRNYELITAMDQWAAELIQQLKDDGLYQNTIVFFWSDHGVGLPRAKRWLYDSGTRIPLIVRIPDRWRVDQQAQEGSVSNQLISSIDFGPTVLNLAGVKVPEHVQGQPFLGPHLPAPRQYVFGARDRMDERYDIIRSVRDQRYRYVRNYEPWKTYYQYMNTAEKGGTMQEIRRLAAAGGLPAAAAPFLADTKPPEELYDLDQDPHELQNLATDPDHQPVLQRLRQAHVLWVQDTRDLGLVPEPVIERREAELGSRYAILRQDANQDLPGRLQIMAQLASSGPQAMDDLRRGLNDSDEVVRYWAAMGIGNLGPDAEQCLGEVTKSLDDASATVQVAAARAVAQLGNPQQALPVLERALQSPEPWVRLQAAIVLDEMDEQARPAVDSLRLALENQPNKYIVRVANRALNELLGTNHEVP